MKIQEIVWTDAMASLKPLSLDEAKRSLKPLETQSIGYLAHETDEYVLLAFMVHKNNIYKHWQVIPKSLILNRRSINVRSKS